MWRSFLDFECPNKSKKEDAKQDHLENWPSIDSPTIDDCALRRDRFSERFHPWLHRAD
jgi:hypothetical protein